MNQKSLVFAGLKNMGFMEEEKIEILKGMDSLEKPTKCVVLKEYPEYLWIKVSFEGNTSDKSSEQRQYCTGINKKAMLCGEVVIRRAGGKIDLTGEEVGIVGLMIRKVKSDTVIIDEPGIDKALLEEARI